MALCERAEPKSSPIQQQQYTFREKKAVSGRVQWYSTRMLTVEYSRAKSERRYSHGVLEAPCDSASEKLHFLLDKSISDIIISSDLASSSS